MGSTCATIMAIACNVIYQLVSKPSTHMQIFKQTIAFDNRIAVYLIKRGALFLQVVNIHASKCLIALYMRENRSISIPLQQFYRRNYFSIRNSWRELYQNTLRVR